MSWPRPAAPMTRLKGRVRKKEERESFRVNHAHRKSAAYPVCSPWILSRSTFSWPEHSYLQFDIQWASLGWYIPCSSTACLLKTLPSSLILWLRSNLSRRSQIYLETQIPALRHSLYLRSICLGCERPVSPGYREEALHQGMSSICLHGSVTWSNTYIVCIIP